MGDVFSLFFQSNQSIKSHGSAISTFSTSVVNDDESSMSRTTVAAHK